MICTILSGPPGCGKTTLLRNTILTRPGRWLLAGPRTALLDEHAVELRAAAKARDLTIPILAIHSRQAAYGSVDRRLQETLAQYTLGEHVVVLITHETLLGLDPTLLAGWHVGIDEIPDTAVLSGAVTATTTWTSLDRHYALEPSDQTGWWQVVPRADVEALTRREITAGGSGLAPLHAAAQNPHRQVYVDVPDWREARRPMRPVRWWSVWTPVVLARCASVTLTGSGFEDSLLQHACRYLHGEELGWAFVQVGAHPDRARPTIRVHYYTRHPGSTEWWETDAGSRCLVAVSRHLERTGFSGYWSSNQKVRPYFRHRFGGEEVDPKQSGTNTLRHHTACCLIYSSKAQADDEPILEVLGLDREAIKLTREYEDVLQFALRGAIRDADYGGAYDVYLYDEAQAVALRDKLLATGIPDRVELMAVEEAGILDVVRPGTAQLEGRNSSHSGPTPHERREQDKAAERDRGRRRRAEAKEQHQQAGTYRGPGRPRKAASRSPEPPHPP